MKKLSDYLIGIGIIGLIIQLAGSGYGGLLMFIAAVWYAWETWKPRPPASEILDASLAAKKAAAAEATKALKPTAARSPDRARKEAAFAAERKRVAAAVEERNAKAGAPPRR